MTNKLYVGNLSFDTAESDLKDLFSQSGTVRETTIISDQMTGRSRGFGFVVMADDAAAQAAVSKLDKYELHGRNLTVNVAKERTERSSSQDSRPARRF